jgi:hypothetical protein
MDNIVHRSCFAGVLIFFLAFTQSCTRTKDRDENVYYLFGSASGSQQTPPVSTPASAKLQGTGDVGAHTLEYSISWSGMSANVTAVNLHGPAAVGASAEIMAELPVDMHSATGHISGWLMTDELLMKYLLDGNVYYSISTSRFPDGEIRGQVFVVHE